MSLMISVSGVRGIVGKSLTPEVIVKYTSAFGEYCRRGTVILGRDGRLTGKSIGHLVSSTLLQMGCNVEAIGICPTPTVALAVEKLKADGGISITASHNPMEWNGLKFFAPTGLFLDAQENGELWKIAETPARDYASWDKQGKHSSIESFVDDHIKSVLALSLIKPQKIRKRRLKVVLDCVNAAGGVIVPKLLKKLGCGVVEINCDVSGVFAHAPEPIPENLTELCRRVKKERADLGIAVDPDVDGRDVDDAAPSDDQCDIGRDDVAGELKQDEVGDREADGDVPRHPARPVQGGQGRGGAGQARCRRPLRRRRGAGKA